MTTEYKSIEQCSKSPMTRDAREQAEAILALSDRLRSLEGKVMALYFALGLTGGMLVAVGWRVYG